MSEHVLHPNQLQAMRLSELGQYLREVRQRQSMSLEQVSEKTMIPVRTLAAIEAGKLDQLPEPVYVKGFIRRYGDAIGVNGAEFATAFPTEVTPEQHHLSPTWRGTVQAQLRPLHLYLLYAGLVMVAISGLSLLLNRSSNPQVYGLKETAQPLPSPGAPSLPGTIYGPPQPGAALSNPFGVVASPSPAVSQKPVRVGLTLTAQSWVRIVVDGKTELEEVLPEGAQRSWAANREVTVRAGNAGGVMISFNESQAKRLGAPGEVEEVTFGKSTATPANGTNRFNGAANSVEAPNLTAAR